MLSHDASINASRARRQHWELTHILQKDPKPRRLPIGWLRSFARSGIIDIAGFCLTISLVLLLILRGAENQGYFWQWYRVPAFVFSVENGHFAAGPIVQGLGVTLNVVWISLLLTCVIGLITALLRLSGAWAARAVARFYLETIRNTPLLVQLYFTYFIIAPVLNIDRMASALLALSLFEGAYASEIFRAGIVSIHKGQWEAAYSLGMGPFQTYRWVILPQAVRRILPPLTNQAVSLVKDSSLVSVLAIYEMTMQANAIVAETFLVFEIYFTIAGIYLILAIALSRTASVLQRYLRIE